MVQLGVHATETKVFKSYAAPLGLCDNLINALKFLANQQNDGDSPMQSIVAGLHERSRKGIMEWLRSFIEEDHHRAVDVGHLRKGIVPSHVRKLRLTRRRPSGKDQMS